MSKEREALKRIAEGKDSIEVVKNLAREALAQPEQEPACCNGNCPNTKDCEQAMQCLYTTQPQRKPWMSLTEVQAFDLFGVNYNMPVIQAVDAKLSELNEAPQRTWVGLTDEEVNELVEQTECEDYYGLVEATEAKLKAKNT